MSMPTVSVCIPSFNYGRFLSRCIRSVLDQTFQDFEVIVLDNRSTDQSELVVRKFMDERVKWRIQSAHCDMVENFRDCARMASGTYLLLLGADDVFYSTMLEESVAMLKAHPTASFVCCAVNVVDDDLRVISTTGNRNKYGLVSSKERLSQFLTGRRTVLSATLIRRQTYEAVGGISTKWKNCFDQDLTFRLILAGDVCELPMRLVAYRTHLSDVQKRLPQIDEDFRFAHAMVERIPRDFPRREALAQKTLKIASRLYILRCASLTGLSDYDRILVKAIDQKVSFLNRILSAMVHAGFGRELTTVYNILQRFRLLAVRSILGARGWWLHGRIQAVHSAGRMPDSHELKQVRNIGKPASADVTRGDGNWKEIFGDENLGRLKACPSCRGTDLTSDGTCVDNLFAIPQRWSLSKCQSCSLVFLNPRPN
ncbi:MAG: hypothetical protein A3F90_07435, partial [Deltaproteobacteria bacterium RIFCSPLOWO2_12_FULL_60_19]